MAIVGAGGFVTAFLVWLAVQFSSGDLDRNDKLASVVSAGFAVAGFFLTWYALVVTVRQGRKDQQLGGALPERLDALVSSLAVAVRAQWEAEERVRRVHDPFPLPVSWKTAEEGIMDHWQNIQGSPERAKPLYLSGHGDLVLDVFRRVPSGRLVILGKAGAGKTVLVSRFVLACLDDLSSTPPEWVPIIFSVGSWDPGASSLRDWMTAQLLANYPVLAVADETGTSMATHLLVTGRIMPVLDGFDEITEGLRVEAIKGINAGLRRGDRVLLTSRPEEYAAAVEAGDVLTAAAVVRLEDLTVEQLADYLPMTTRRGRRGDPQNKWDSVVRRMRDGNDGPQTAALVEALSTPLMVALARSIFSDTSRDPAELLARQAVAAEDLRHELEDRLLAGFVPAVYSRTPDDRPAEGKRRYGSDDAQRWLVFLARHLDSLRTFDLAWWRLIEALPRTVIGFASGLVISSMVWLVAGTAGLLGRWSGSGQVEWSTSGLIFGAGCGLVGGTIVGLTRGIRPLPARLRLQLRRRVRHVLRNVLRSATSWRTMVWNMVWAAGGLGFGYAASLSISPRGGPLLGLLAGILIGFGVWFVSAFVRALGTPVDPAEMVSPVDLLLTDRATAVRQGLLVGVGGSLVTWLVIWFAFEGVFAQPFEQVFGGGVWLLSVALSSAAGTVIWMLFVTVWGPWLIARFCLSVTGRLPWAVMDFLADAHRRGVLRQVGGVYQFRHARLQGYLASRHGPTAQVVPEDG